MDNETVPDINLLDDTISGHRNCNVHSISADRVSDSCDRLLAGA